MLSTRKETVSQVSIKSQELLIRAGFIRQLSAGIFSSLHLAHRSLTKIGAILRKEMNGIGGVEVSLPIVHPASLWKRTKRYQEIDESLLRFTDRAGREMVLGMTHEEVVASLAKSEISSYRQLPKLIYQLQTKFRDEARPRGGLIRVREFTMKDSYSLDTSWEALQLQYDAHYEAYLRMFARVGLPVMVIQSDVGMMGGKVAHEYMYITEIGEDTIFLCDSSGYRANKEVATIQKNYPAATDPLPLGEVHTPGTKTIEDLANYLESTAESCGKVVFFSAEVEGMQKVILAVVRGDMEVNEVKLQNLIRSKTLEPATDEEIRAIGAAPGYASPIGIDREKAIVVVDDLIPPSMNLIVGANKEHYHLRNACYGRDFEADFVGDIINAFDGALAPNAQTDEDRLRSVRGVEVGNIFQLGTKYTEALEARFIDRDGRPKPIVMGSYGIGVGRLLGCLAEEYHDELGLHLPISVAPYQVMLVGLLENDEVKEQAEKLYEQLKAHKVEVLFDDRHIKLARPGEKFADADLIGLPIRLTISKRSLKNGGVELKLRTGMERQLVPLEEVCARVLGLIGELMEELKAKTGPNQKD